MAKHHDACRWHWTSVYSVCHKNTETCLVGSQPAAIDSGCQLDIQYFPCRGVLQQQQQKKAKKKCLLISLQATQPLPSTDAATPPRVESTRGGGWTSDRATKSPPCLWPNEPDVVLSNCPTLRFASETLWMTKTAESPTPPSVDLHSRWVEKVKKKKPKDVILVPLNIL